MLKKVTVYFKFFLSFWVVKTARLLLASISDPKEFSIACNIKLMPLLAQVLKFKALDL
jgi:hypothetical protein